MSTDVKALQDALKAAREENEAAGNIAGCLATMVSFVGVGIAWFHSLSVLWAWFIVSIFPGAPLLGPLQIFAAVFVLNVIRSGTPLSVIEKRKKTEYEGWAMCIFGPWMTLGFLWLIAFAIAWGLGVGPWSTAQ